MPVLKLSTHNEEKEIDFELKYLASLSRKERFALMFEKTEEILALLENSGHRKTPKVIKRK